MTSFVTEDRLCDHCEQSVLEHEDGRGCPVGVIIGRFQVDEIHKGHVLLMDYVKRRHRSVLVLLGVRKSPASQLNPLNYHIREQMIREYLPEAVILPVIDTAADETWSRQVDTLVEAAYPTRNAVLYAGRDGFIPHYKGRFTTKELHLDGTISGTIKRRQIAEQTRNSPDFRAGVIYAISNLGPRIYPTVDIAVYRRPAPPSAGDAMEALLARHWWRANTEILLGRKPDEASWRLPGGFVGSDDTSLEMAARRELREETNLTCEGGLEYVGSFAVDDWRNRDTVDVKILTTLFAMPYSHGAPQAGDDLAEVQWFLLDAADSLVISDHKPLVQALQKRFGKEPTHESPAQSAATH